VNAKKSGRRIVRLLPLLAITITGVVIYYNALGTSFHLDDVPNISDNPLIQTPDFLTAPDTYCSQVSQFTINYTLCQFFKRRYVGYLTFALNYHLHGLDVSGYHLVNMGIHIANALLVYFLVLRLLETPFLKGAASEKTAHFISFFSAMLFVAHPIQTQAVTYIVQRFTSLATLFYLSSIVFYVKARLRLTAADEEKARTCPLMFSIFLALSVVFAMLAMFTKEISFTLPVMVVLLEFSFFRGSPRKRLLLLSPLLLTMLIVPYNVIGVAKPLGGLLSDASMASRVQTAVSRGDYLVTQCVVIATYIRLLLVPINQNLDYDFPLYHSLADPAVLFSSSFLLSIICVGWYLYYRSRCSARALRLVAFGIFWFFIALSVESSVIPIADVIFEHRAYLPSVGACLAFSAAAGFGGERLAVRHRLGWKTAVSVLGGIVLIFAVGTIQRNTVWHDEETLWRDVVRKSPDKARGFNNLALAYLKKGEFEKAGALFDRAIALDPRYADAYNNRGNLSEKINQNEKAIEDYSRAIEINPYDADYYYNRGYVRSKKKEYEAAIRDFSRAIELDPRHDKAYVQRGFASYLLLNNAYAASPDFLKACELGNSVGCEVFRNSFTGGMKR